MSREGGHYFSMARTVYSRMTAMPPPGESNYPREAPTSGYGTADKLQALGDGYYGLNRVFFINFIVVICGLAAAMTGHPWLWLGLLLILFVLTLALSYPQNKKIAFGMDWNPGYAILASILTALFCWFCFGALGYVVMQMIAAAEMKRYGLKSGFGGIKKPVLKTAVAELRAVEASRGNAGSSFMAS